MIIPSFIADMPKAELHLHIEGTLSAAKVLALAERNGVDIPYSTENELLAAQDYGDPPLESFLKYHYMCIGVLRHAHDIYEITESFLKKSSDQNVRHVELAFEPSVHLNNGIEFGDLIDALNMARNAAAKKSGISSQIIMCIDRSESQENAMQMLDFADRQRDDIVGIGLEAYEEGNPPIKFVEFYRRAKEEGYRLTAHCDCDQKNSTTHIHQCIHDLNVERIDHGLHTLDDPGLISDVKERNITLTMCPTWRPSDSGPRRVAALRKMLDLGISVCINTDDPEEFASRYLSHMMTRVQHDGNFSAADMAKFMRNAFNAAWLSDEKKAAFISELDTHLAKYVQ